MDNNTDYSQMENWAAFPDKRSQAQALPAFLSGEKIKIDADVFFIHPTTYICADHGHCAVMIDRNAENRLRAGENKDPWNAALSDETLNHMTDTGPIKSQATVFNGRCRIFAPRYRQAHLKAFFLEGDARAEESLAVAYSDVSEAFEYYLNHLCDGRPLFIAGHSQGSFHGIRLLKEYFEGKALARRLAAAYLPGIQLRREDFVSLPFLKCPGAVGGVLGWRSFQRGAMPEELPPEHGDSLCVNPLTWTDTLEPVETDENPGLLDFDTPMAGGMRVTIEPRTRVLLVDLPKTAPMRAHQNLHLYDYKLFWQAIRRNIDTRLEHFMR
ncbi:MAG: DUF3089 domain-containing protein [Eubacterium sp.]|nr:DUF3089 domain-containing protein [Eubacterium sp.]